MDEAVIVLVDPDHVAAGAAAARTLYEAGHRRLAVIEGPKTAHDDTLQNARLPGNAAQIRYRYRADSARARDLSPEGGRAGARELLERGKPFTAVFCLPMTRRRLAPSRTCARLA